MKITKMEPQQKHNERLSIFVDGQFGFGLHMDVVMDNGLKIGREITEAEVAEFKTADAFRTAYDKAIGYLAARPRSKREMQQYLRDKLVYHHPDYAGVTSDERDAFVQQQESSIERIMQKLIESNYIDDVIFAKWWIDNRRQFRPRGKRLLLLELQAKGISATDIGTALTTPDEEGHFNSELSVGDEASDIAEATSEEAMAMKLALKQQAKYKALDEFEFKNKMSRFLASKGFDWETIEAVLKKLKEQSA